MVISQKYITKVNEDSLDEIIEKLKNRSIIEQEQDIGLLEIHDNIDILERINLLFKESKEEKLDKLRKLIYTINLKRIKNVMSNKCCSKEDQYYISMLYSKLLNNNPRVQKYDNNYQMQEINSFKKKKKNKRKRY